jgi:hypothetical protein
MQDLSQENLERLIKKYDLSPGGYRDEYNEGYLDISDWFENGLLVYEPFLRLVKFIPCLYEATFKKGSHYLEIFQQLKEIVPWCVPGKPAYFLAMHACGFLRSRDRRKGGGYSIFAKPINLSENSPQKARLLAQLNKSFDK